jgi:hypothetical protein
MDIIMMIIGLISMVATVISCIIAVRAKNESKRILSNIQSVTLNTGQQEVENEGDFEIENSGHNDGVMAGIVTGGIKNDKK